MIEPKRFRKRPVQIEAVLWDGTPAGAAPVIDWINTLSTRTATWREAQPFTNILYYGEEVQGVHPEGIYIKTLEGELHVSPGDWVIRGVAGEFYPVKPAIFEATYEEIS